MRTLRRSLKIAFVLLLAACGTHPAERNNAGNWHSGRGEYEQAIQAYRAAQVAEPDNAVLYFNAAAALGGSGDIEAAVSSLDQAIARGDDALAASAFHNLGNLYFQQNDYANAIDAYQEALLRNPSDNDTRYNLELALLRSQMVTPTAIEMQTDPDMADAETSITPTNNPAGPENPTPTPTPGVYNNIAQEGGTPQVVEGFKGTERALTITPMIGQTPTPTRSPEEIDRLLKPIENDVRTMEDFLGITATPGEPASGKDW